jgi:hypothetical protein
MFKMRNVHNIQNLSAAFPEKSGVFAQFLVSTSGTPSLFEIILKNPFHEAHFQWNPLVARIGVSVSLASTSISGVSVTSTQGQSRTVAVQAPYENILVTLSIRGGTLQAKMSAPSFTKQVSYTVPDMIAYDVFDRWEVFVNSSPTEVPSEVSILSSYITGDALGGSQGFYVEFLTLTEGDALNKYVLLQRPPSRSIAVNITQAATQKLDVDFTTIGNKLTWAGLGLDIPAMHAGTTLRVIYSAAATSSDPAIEKVGKKLVSLKG